MDFQGIGFTKQGTININMLVCPGFFFLLLKYFAIIWTMILIEKFKLFLIVSEDQFSSHYFFNKMITKLNNN